MSGSLVGSPAKVRKYRFGFKELSKVGMNCYNKALAAPVIGNGSRKRTLCPSEVRKDCADDLAYWVGGKRARAGVTRRHKGGVEPLRG
jgi:hypothetical protein